MTINPVFNVLIEAANQWPNKTAIYDDLGKQTFAELFSEAEKLRVQLLANGVKEGMAVGVMAKNGRNFIAGIFAVIGTGAVAMPMSHQLKSHEISEAIEGAQLSALVDDTSSKDFQPIDASNIQLTNGVFRLTWFNERFSSHIFAPHVADPAFMRFTSGTTGKAKGVIISHQSALERTEGVVNALFFYFKLKNKISSF